MSTKWPDEMTFESFCELFPITQENIYRELYYHFRDQIKVQREEAAVRNLEIIFKATFKLTSRSGFHAMSLRDLSRETNISMGGLYNYIGSKDDLALMIEEFAGGKLGGLISEMTEEVVEADRRIERFIRFFVYAAELFQPWLFFMFMEAKNLSRENRARAKAFEQRNITWLRDIIIEGQEHGAHKKIDPMLTSSMLFAMLENWYLKRWHYTLSDTSVDEYADYCVNLVRKIL
jgi:TetR/AcrR family transcriptional regulator, cholesterol catabolism regulator